MVEELMQGLSSHGQAEVITRAGKRYRELSGIFR
jgi:hypothetical protein